MKVGDTSILHISKLEYRKLKASIFLMFPFYGLPTKILNLGSSGFVSVVLKFSLLKCIQKSNVIKNKIWVLVFSFMYLVLVDAMDWSFNSQNMQYKSFLWVSWFLSETNLRPNIEKTPLAKQTDDSTQTLALTFLIFNATLKYGIQKCKK